MERSGVLFAQIQDVPKNSLILLSGPPGAGKSTFCQQAVLNGLAMDRPVIFVATEQGPAEIIEDLKERGMGELPPGALSFVDAFGETVGAESPERTDTVAANCEDLNSISMAITKLRERTGRGDVLLAFDSLTSPYLFNREEMFKFMRLCLAKFAAEGNSALALMDEGCGKEEDLGAMMSVADGILRMEVQEDSRILHVVKHPSMETTRIEVPIQPKEPRAKPPTNWDIDGGRQLLRSMIADKRVLRPEVGDFVHLFWPSLAHWSCMLWDPKGFPTVLYETNRYESALGRQAIPSLPRSRRYFLKAAFALQSLGLFPRRLSSVRDMKKFLWGPAIKDVEKQRAGILEYLEDVSKTDEHYFRLYECSDCVGFESVGVPMASHLPPFLAGVCEAFENDGREWNAIETRCIGLGDPYCEIKLVPGEIDGLNASLRKDSSLVERIHGRLMERLMGFLLDGKPLVERPRLGSDVHLHVMHHGMGFVNFVSERYRRAQMMGAARSAKMIGERLLGAGLSEDDAVKRVLDFMNTCKVGKVTLRARSGQALGESVRISENCDSLRTTILVHEKRPSCFFTTGFLNGLFSAVKGQHVREIKCIAAGDAYCEWEIV